MVDSHSLYSEIATITVNYVWYRYKQVKNRPHRSTAKIYAAVSEIAWRAIPFLNNQNHTITVWKI